MHERVSGAGGGDDLRTIPELARRFDVPAGFPITRWAWRCRGGGGFGTCIIEKHLTLARAAGGPDSAFSLDPQNSRRCGRGPGCESPGKRPFWRERAGRKHRVFRRSLFVVRDVKVGEKFTSENVRSIRPGNGLAHQTFAGGSGKTRRLTLDRVLR